jgi:Divergent InlB B-repeat domain
MKKTLIYFIITLLIITAGHSFSAVLTYTSGIDTGARDRHGVYLNGSGDTGTENFAANDLVQLIAVGANNIIDPVGPNFAPGGDDILIDETTIGWGRYACPVNGEWYKILHYSGIEGSYEVYVRVFDCSKTFPGPRWYGNSPTEYWAFSPPPGMEFNIIEAGGMGTNILDPYSPHGNIISIIYTPPGSAIIRWGQIPEYLYYIYWSDGVDTGSFHWDKVDTPALNDIVYNGDNTWSWTDKGTDPEMNGKTPGDVDQRFYMIKAFIPRYLMVTSTTGGSVTTPGEGFFVYEYGDTVSLNSHAEDHHHFVNWSGDITSILDPGSSNTSIVMNANCTIQANFEIDTHTLALSSGGGGSVTVPGEGDFIYDYGETVPLTAAPDIGHHFAAWTGETISMLDPSSATTSIVMTADYAVQATFEIDTHTLSVSSTEGGTVTAPGEGGFVYDYGETVALIADPQENYHFVGWTGDTTTINDPQSASTWMSIEGDYAIQANFEIDTRTLNTSSNPGGTVTAPGEGQFVYDYGETVPLIVAPEVGHHFIEWIGDILTIDNPFDVATSILIDADYYIDAVFEPDTHMLTVSTTVGGTVTAPGEGSFIHDYGETVSLTVEPDPGLYFTGWSGDIGTIDDPNSANTWILINGDHIIEANFDMLPDAYAMSWRSVRAHLTYGLLSIDLDPVALPAFVTTEPREGGIQRIEIDFDGPVVLQGGGSIYVADGTDTYTPTSYNLANGNQTLEIHFDPGVLPNAQRYTIDIAGLIENLAGDPDCVVGALEGDSNSDGFVTTIDILIIQDNTGQPANLYPRLDLDLDGTVYPPDLIVVQNNLGNALP